MYARLCCAYGRRQVPRVQGEIFECHRYPGRFQADFALASTRPVENYPGFAFVAVK